MLEAVHEIFPEAPIYTSIFWPEALPPAYQDWDIRTSFLNRFPFIHRHHQWYLPLYPYAFEGFDFSEYDLVLSITSAFAHGIITSPKTLHICYCLNPARFLWDYHAYIARENIGYLVRMILPLFLYNLRLWDRLAADRVDHFLAISRTVQQRILKFYGRNAEIIHPPVDVRRFSPSSEHGDYFLIISRLVPYKRIDLAVQAFSQLGLPLYIIGDGRDRNTLEAMAAPNVRFLGRVDDEAIAQYLSKCRAFIFPGEEDFGIAPLEAQAAGRPVIAYAGGGALETVVDGKTGLFFYEQTPEALAEAVQRFDETCFDSDAIRVHALRFDRKAFQRKLADFVYMQCAKGESA